ncbi:MAG: prepilin-type N-terminal cleavage/methylation domain-containing protein [Proteobacteria bacterium]|nr:MAG: prepilin-type N-terminal cleavage/methylation domain-containing protein [Pseudomonadota bacterium]
MKSNRGFTLIEVVISLMILAMLSVLTTNAMRRAIDNRELVANDVARDARLADAIRVFRADITSAYHHRDFLTKLTNEAKDPNFKEESTTPAGGGNPPPPTPPPNGGGDAPPRICINDITGAQEPCTKPTPPQLTGFVGDSSSLYLTTLSNIRTIRDSAESNQAKVGYYTKSCQVRNEGKTFPSKCLYRSTSPIIDKELTTPGPETVLLENVEQFQLRYLGPGNDDYVDTWKTGEGAPAATKEKFPYAVEITLTTQNKNDRKDKKTTSSALVPLWFPNNDKDKNKGNSGKTIDDVSNAGEDP